MKPARRLNRRSFLAAVAGTVAAAGALTVAATDAAEAFQSGDTDSGPYADPAGRPRRGYRSGCTDSDSGPYEDQRGNGRCRRRVVRSGCTDNDSGPYADQRGNGRCRRRYYGRRCSDSDSGPYADRQGHGRRC